MKLPEEHVQVLEEVQDEHKVREALPEERVADAEKEEAVDGLQVLPEIRTPAVAAQWDRSRSHSRGMEALKVRQDDEKMRAENCTTRKTTTSLKSEGLESCRKFSAQLAPRKGNVRKKEEPGPAARNRSPRTRKGRKKQRGLKRPDFGRGLRQGR